MSSNRYIDYLGDLPDWGRDDDEYMPLSQMDSETIKEELERWLNEARILGENRKLNSINVQAVVEGWVALDDSGEAWFFPGKEKPEKKDGEWIGFSPIRVRVQYLSSADEEILKKLPKFITLTS